MTYLAEIHGTVLPAYIALPVHVGGLGLRRNHLTWFKHE